MSERVLGGRYTVQDKIGTGGMAIVYRGLDEVLGRTVAIKTMLPQYAADPSFAARFKQEAQAAAALQSPYIVAVYDWGKDGDTYYIVMEYLRGTDLKSGIRKHGALDGKKVAQIGSQIAQALSVAHRHDIIHRDIKPQNIMVQPDGNIKVMDFGIARAKNSHLTQDNSVLGTAHYVSPEQTQGKALGPTTDIYSLGIVMYEAATGKVPFDGDDAISVALKQVNELPVPPSQVNPAVDASLESIILKCMQKNPDDRFQTADELYHVLRDYLSGRLAAVSNATAMMNPVGAVPVTTPLSPVSSTQSMSRISETGRIKPQTATEKAQQEAEEKERKHKRRLISAAIVGAIAVVAIIVGVFSMFGNNATQPVPNLLNLTQEQALSQIDESGFFQRGTVKEEYSSSVAKGLVIDQDPDPGRQVSKGTQINLVISKGEEPAETVTVPDLTGMTPSEAEAALTKVGLVGQAGDSVYDSDTPVGTVAQQSPNGGATAKAGDTVTYQLSKGPETVDVPDVTGQTESDATAQLKDAGFEVQVTTAESSSVDKGLVIKQSKTGTAEKGATITITVSTGNSKVKVPSVVGMQQDAAEAALANAGFKYNVVTTTSDVSSGQVISQDITGTADPGTTVTIKVSTGPEPSTGGHSGTGAAN
ncbi:Stk1 family PASTA domain-containing Ser/Thr kinase [Parafannyhessea umbonata]|uniref:non-specific serine/threonine protein kinase n=1 Tax=Parafannyhessea umbonata TaxID=604330 RepID=A0A1H9Q4Y0_9ACTN|nr:Stk1 family PASTA domain-containing Ser/Thr kinase [Parafannyhessea umbonata]SER55500.1 serine/threonine protein kinase [Parafannyhessea umbonata]